MELMERLVALVPRPRVHLTRYHGVLAPRVFNIDVETCSKCGGRMKVIAAIEDPKIIRKILDHRGLDTKPPPLKPARGPPSPESHFTDDFYQQHFEDFQ